MNIKAFKILLLSSSLFGLFSKQAISEAQAEQTVNHIIQNPFALPESQNTISGPVISANSNWFLGFQDQIGSSSPASSPATPGNSNQSSGFQDFFGSLRSLNTVSNLVSSTNTLQPISTQEPYSPYEFTSLNYPLSSIFNDSAAQQRADQFAAQQRTEREAAQQRADQFAAQQRTEREAAQQRIDQFAAQRRADLQASSARFRQELLDNAARQRASESLRQGLLENGARIRAENERHRSLEQESDRTTEIERLAVAQQRENRLIAEQAAIQQIVENDQTAEEQAIQQRAEAIYLAILQIPLQPRLEADHIADPNIDDMANLEAERIEALRVAFEDVRPATWQAMSQEQRIILMVDELLQRPNFRTLHSIPADANLQAQLKNKIRTLMIDKYIDIDEIVVPIDEPRNIAFILNNYVRILKTAMNVQKYESAPFNMTIQEAKEFNTFVAKFNEFPDFPLALEKKLLFYKSLKANFDGISWEDVTKALKPILQNSFPIDYKEWPNFEENPDANLDNFIENVMVPCVNVVQGSINVEEISKAYVDNLLIMNQENLKRTINQNIAVYQNLNAEYTLDQKNLHGSKIPLPNSAYVDNFRDLTDNIYYTLLDLEDQTSVNPVLKHRINYSNLCADPFLTLLRLPDEKLIPLTDNYGNHHDEIQALKTKVFNSVPTDERGLDAEFDDSFGDGGFGLNYENDLNKKTMIRIKRLYECIKENKDELTAAKVIYQFGGGMSDRCVDGKRDRLTELERQYVYVANDLTANGNLNTTIGLSLSKLFMDDRMDKLRETINTLYNAGEPQTYAWYRSHRALFLGFGLSGKYDEILYGTHHRMGVDPIDFVEKYFKGGTVTGEDSTRVHNLDAFTLDKMTNLVLEEIKKAMGGLFDDNTLDYMINSNIALRRSYLEFQANAGNENFENDYFKNANLSQRLALKKEAVTDLLRTYNYIYTKNDDDRWE